MPVIIVIFRISCDLSILLFYCVLPIFTSGKMLESKFHSNRNNVSIKVT